MLQNSLRDPNHVLLDVIPPIFHKAIQNQWRVRRLWSRIHMTIICLQCHSLLTSMDTWFDAAISSSFHVRFMISSYSKPDNKMESLIFLPSEHLILFYKLSVIANSRNLISQRSTILWLSLNSYHNSILSSIMSNILTHHCSKMQQ